MNFQWTKQETLLDNIVNADTPGYKAKYVTFEEALRDNLRRAQVGETPVSTMRGVLEAAQPTVRTAEDESFRMDENGVNVAEQQLELVRNAYQIQHVYNALNSDMQRLHSRSVSGAEDDLRSGADRRILWLSLAV